MCTTITAYDVKHMHCDTNERCTLQLIVSLCLTRGLYSACTLVFNGLYIPLSVLTIHFEENKYSK